MLIDDAIDNMEYRRSTVEEHLIGQLDMVLDLFSLAEPFVLSPLVMQTCEDLIDPQAVERSRPHLFTPAVYTWLDCSAQRPSWIGNVAGFRRAGVALLGAKTVPSQHGSLTRGPLAIVVDTHDGFINYAGKYDLQSGARIVAPAFDKPTPIDFNRLGQFIACALALINTPRLADVRTAELSKLNKARLKRRQPPLLQYRTVHIKVDAGKPGIGAQLHETQQRALHHVRAFMRLKRGRVEIVRPHWRGNARFGVIKHRYVVLRAEDQPGTWEGGPMPAPVVIK